MQNFNYKNKNKEIILALGAESAGNFSVYIPSLLSKGGARGGLEGQIYFSKNFGGLLEEKNWLTFQKAALNFIKKSKIKPDIIITDLHPSMKTTLWGEILAKKYKAQHIQVQHHQAHIFSAIGESLLPLPLSKGEVGRGLSQITSCKLLVTSYGIALDGTGYGEDGKIWGGEVFQLRTVNCKLRTTRIGSLENQILLGGELAIKEPARMLIAILAKIPNLKFQVTKKFQNLKSKSQKEFIYEFVKKYYSKNKFELLYNQLEQNFNCIETSSAGRILDAVSLLLGFCKNERLYKHESIDLLEKNSTKPYEHLLPLIEGGDLPAGRQVSEGQRGCYRLNTTYLFEYLLNNLHKDKKRLAATAQLYIAEGLYEIVKKSSVISHQSFDKNQPLSLCHPCLPAGRLNFDSGSPTIFAAGGVTNNKIISEYFTSKNILLNNTIPRGDAGLSFGQITYFLLKK